MRRKPLTGRVFCLGPGRPEPCATRAAQARRPAADPPPAPIGRRAEHGAVQARAERRGAPLQESSRPVLRVSCRQQVPQHQPASDLRRKFVVAQPLPTLRGIGGVGGRGNRGRDPPPARKRIADAIAGQRVGEVRGIADAQYATVGDAVPPDTERDGVPDWAGDRQRRVAESACDSVLRDEAVEEVGHGVPRAAVVLPQRRRRR